MKPTKAYQPLRKIAEEVLGPSGAAEIPAPAPLSEDEGASSAAAAGLCAMMDEAKHNARSYRAAASALKIAGHRECSKYFKHMAEKWCGTAHKIESFVEDLGRTIQFGASAPVEAMDGDPASLAQKFFALEKAMSEKMYAFMRAAEESDPPVHEFLCNSVDKRVKMEKCARQFMRLTQLAGDDFMGLDHSVKHWFRG